MKHFGDITKINGAEVPIVDVICGGSPCQDLSVAGKRAGLSGERSGLFMEQIRIVKEMRENDRRNGSDGRTDKHIRPRYMVWENVPGALSSPGKRNGEDHRGEDFQAVLSEIVKVVKADAPDVPLPENRRWPHAGCLMGIGDNGQPFSIAWRIHDAQFWGVPQRRKRIALVADFGGQTAPEILFERKSVSGDSPESGEEGEGAPSDAERCTNPSSYTLKIRGGVERDSAGKKAGKGPLVQTELSGTLGVSQDQTLITNCLNGWDVQSKHVQPEDGVAESLYAGECRGGGGESYVLQSQEPILLESNQNHAQVKTDGISNALPAAMGEGGGYVPMIVDEPESTICLNDQGGQQMDVSEEVGGMLRAEDHGHQPIVFEPGAASRVGGHVYEDGVSGTIRANAGDNQLAVAYGVTTKGDGDAILTEERHMSLSTGGGQAGQGYPAVVYGISSDGSNAMRSDNPHSGIYEAETARTLDLNGGSPACNQGGMAIVQGCDTYNLAVTGDTAASLTAGGNTSTGSDPKVICCDRSYERSEELRDNGELSPAITEACGTSGNNTPIVCLEGNGMRESHRGNGYVESDTMYTLNTVEQHAVAYRKTSHAKTADDGQGRAETEVNDTLNAFDSGEAGTPTVVVEGFDSYNLQPTGDVGRTLTTPSGGLNEHMPVVLENHPNDSRVKVSEDGKVQTLSGRMGTGGGNVPMVMETYQETTGSLCASGHDKLGTQEAMNDMFVVEGSSWDGSQTSPTLTANNAGGNQRMPDKDNFNAVVQSMEVFHCTNDEERVQTLKARDYKDPQVVAYGLDRASFNQGENAKFDFSVEEEKIGAQVARGPGAVCSENAVVRRLTPLECERLQGFPDGWTDIGDWVDSKGKTHKGESDSPRYKALGNSIALPFWKWMAERMVNVLKEDGVENPTMASLFDGIGGFPLSYERVGCKAVWASEIEEFPIAVTKIRFPDIDE